MLISYRMTIIWKTTLSCRDRFLTTALECLYCRRCPWPTPTFAAGRQRPPWRRLAPHRQGGTQGQGVPADCVLGLGVGKRRCAWITLSGFSTTPMTADTACTRSEPSASCTQTIVTGSIGKVDQPQWPEPRPAAAFATHASSEPISAIEQLQLSAPQIPKAATTPTEREDDSGKVGNRVDNGNERTGTANAAAESDPLPAATTPKTSLLLPQNVSADRHDCRELRAAGQSINIPFDYASSSLNQAVLPALEVLCSEAAVLSVDQGDYRRPHRFRRACSLEPVAIGSSGQSGVRASCPCRRAAKSVVGDWIWAIPPLRTQRVDQEQAQQPTRRVGCRCPSLSYV